MSEITTVQGDSRTIDELGAISRIQAVRDDVANVAMAELEMGWTKQVKALDGEIEKLNSDMLELSVSIAKDTKAIATELTKKEFNAVWRKIKTILHPEATINHYGNLKEAGGKFEADYTSFKASVKLYIRDYDGDNGYIRKEVRQTDYDDSLLKLKEDCLLHDKMKKERDQKHAERRKVQEKLDNPDFTERQLKATVTRHYIREIDPGLLGTELSDTMSKLRGDMGNLLADSSE